MKELVEQAQAEIAEAHEQNIIAFVKIKLNAIEHIDSKIENLKAQQEKLLDSITKIEEEDYSEFDSWYSTDTKLRIIESSGNGNY